MITAGLDIGTTGCKMTVFNGQGEQIGKAYRDYPASRNSGAHEVDITAMRGAVRAVIREMAAQHPSIRAVGVTSFGETFVMADEAGEPLFPATLYTDPRGNEECGELVRTAGAERIARITGAAPDRMYSAARIMWIRKHHPEVYRKTKRIFLIQDYFVWLLTGRAQIDYSLAARTMLFDINTLRWSAELTGAAGIDSTLMSEPVPSGTKAGTVTPEAAAETGLDPGCTVVTVAHDQVAAAVGAGAFDGTVAVDGAGTTECLTPVYDSLPDISVMSRGNFSVVPYAVPGKYVAYAFNYTGGALIQWCMELFGRGETYDSMEAAYRRDEPTGLLVLPHFAGAATPYMDIASKGAILGLTMETDAATVYRACMEGVAYEMRVNYEALAGSDIHFDRLHATGGGAKSEVWTQMKADVLNLPITALRIHDAGTVGSAMLTGIAMGLYRDLRDAAEHMVRTGKTYEPRAEMHEQYSRIYERYKKVYAAVRPLV